MQLCLNTEELTGLEAAFAASGGDAAPAARVELAWHLRQRDSRRALALLDGLFTAAPGADAQAFSALRARVALVRCEVAALFCEVDEAEGWLARAREDLAHADDATLGVDLLLAEATLARTLGQQAREMTAYQHADPLARALGDTQREGVVRGLAALEQAGSQPGFAVDSLPSLHGDEALEPVHEALFSAARALALSRREPAVAAELFLHASELAQQTGWIRVAITSLLNAGAALQGLADYDGAAACFGDALQRARATAWPAMLGACRTCVGRLLREQGQLEASRAVLAAAVQVLAPAATSMNAANALAELAQTLLAMGRGAESVAPMAEAVQVLRQLGANGNLALTLIAQARVLSAAGRPEDALGALNEVEAMITTHGLQALRAGVYDALTELHRRHALPAPADTPYPSAVVHYAELTLGEGQKIPGWKPPASLLAALADAWADTGAFDRGYDYARRAFAAKSEETTLKLSNPLALLRLMQLEEAESGDVVEAPDGNGSGDGDVPHAASLSATMLTPKEREVLRLLARSYSNKEIALTLAISSETVKTHLKRIFTKLDAYSRKHAVSRARDLGMLTLAY